MADTDVTPLVEDASLLGDVYLKMFAHGWTLDANHNFKPGADHVEDRILVALSERNVELKDDADEWERDYLAAFFSARRHLQAKAAETGRDLLTEQMKSLTDLRKQLRTGDTAAAISAIAVNVREVLGGYEPSARDHATTARIYGPPELPSTSSPDNLPYKNPRYDGGLQIVFRQSVRAALGAELERFGRPLDSSTPNPARPGWTHRGEIVDLCKVLSLHPKFVDIFDAYAESQDHGAKLSDSLVWEATDATGKLYVELLVSDEVVWRYSPFVIAGVKKLGLSEVKGFQDYAVALAALIGERWYRVPLMFVGIALSLLALLLAGPAAAVGGVAAGALVAVGVADFAVNVFNAAVDFIDDRAQEVAALSSGFDAEKLAEPPSYFGSALSAAAALMCGIGVVTQGRQAMAALPRGPRPRPGGVSGFAPDPTGTKLLAAPARRTTSQASKLADAKLAAAKRAGPRGMSAGQRPRKPGDRPPKLDAGPGVRGTEEKQVAATGTGGPGDVPPGKPGPGSPPSVDVPGSGGTVSGSGGAKVIQLPVATPPGNSTVVDTTIQLTPAQRRYGTVAAWQEAEDQVGVKLQKAVQLPMLPPESEAALALSTPLPRRQGVTQPLKGPPITEPAPPITRPVLIKAPIVTRPSNPPPAWSVKEGKYIPPETSAVPDYLYLTPDRMEVFEATLDVRFQIGPEDVMRGTSQRFGSAHKEIQLWKAEYLIERYPNLDLVYNVQTVGQFPAKALESNINAALGYLNNVRRRVGGTGRIQIIIRADTTHVFL